MEKERCLISLIGDILYIKLFDAVQASSVLVHSHPFVPDDVAILHAFSQLWLADPSAAALTKALPQGHSISMMGMSVAGAEGAAAAAAGGSAGVAPVAAARS